MSKVGSGRNGQVTSKAFASGARSPSAIPAGSAARPGIADVRVAKPAAAKTITGAVPLGNELAKNVGKGGPGVGRTVHGSGSQGRH